MNKMTLEDIIVLHRPEVLHFRKQAIADSFAWVLANKDCAVTEYAVKLTDCGTVVSIDEMVDMESYPTTYVLIEERKATADEIDDFDDSDAFFEVDSFDEDDAIVPVDIDRILADSENETTARNIAKDIFGEWSQLTYFKRDCQRNYELDAENLKKDFETHVLVRKIDRKLENWCKRNDQHFTRKKHEMIVDALIDLIVEKVIVKAA